MALEFEVKDAVRETVPVLACVYGPTGSGKTYSGLLLAAGLAGPNGIVGMVDAENKRGSLYADDPDICAAMPGGRYKRLDLRAPYSPSRYIKALQALEKAGCTVALVDSTTHEWSGEDGCCDIAEKNKMGGFPNWAKAKLEHKRFLAYCLSSHMHIVFCLRAHEKVKPVKAGDLVSPDSQERYEKAAVIPLGMLPDCEKNFVYEMLISLRVDDGTHLAHPVKVPKMLAHIFPGKKLITKADGEAIRLWNESAGVSSSTERIAERARLAAEEGTAAYAEFFSVLSPAAKKFLASTTHAENKAIAAKADAAASEHGDLPDLADFPAPDACDDKQVVRVKGALYRYHIDTNKFEPLGEAA
jgi:hypothetical protein